MRDAKQPVKSTTSHKTIYKRNIYLILSSKRYIDKADDFLQTLHLKLSLSDYISIRWQRAKFIFDIFVRALIANVGKFLIYHSNTIDCLGVSA
jgi:hypothetical protein